MTTRAFTAEIGTKLPTRLTSTLYDDFLPQLRGRKAMQVYREMADNDATIGAALYLVEQYARQVTWTVEGDDDATVQALTDELDGLPDSWDDFLAAALSEIVYGWSLFEIVYGRRGSGWGWDKLAFRPQMSLHKWELDENGDIAEFLQDTGRGSIVPIPIEKCVHFRTTTATGQPEGRSLLRRAYRAWWFKHRIEDFLGIGIERDLNGLPHMRVPLEVILEGGTEYGEWKKLVTGVRVNDQAGIITPLEYDENGNPLYELEVLQSNGRAKVDAHQVWRSFAQDMAAVLVAEFSQLGRDAVGSRALGESKVSTFATALEALLDQVEEQFHRQATMRLAELNGWTDVPRVKHGDVEAPDLDTIGMFLLRTSQAGLLQTRDVELMPEDDDSLSDDILRMAGFDVEDTVEG